MPSLREQVIAALRAAADAAHAYEVERNENRRKAIMSDDPREAHFAVSDHAEALALVTTLSREIRIFGK